ncbi:hypothetical protein CW304_31480 [Bacillus sp. UFRGS-B20]|nr:hypothetical protein CW304_31480 [Bacillus sp. UFRGS-B20]
MSIPSHAIRPDFGCVNKPNVTTPSPNTRSIESILPTIDVTINALTGNTRYLDLPRKFWCFFLGEQIPKHTS